jgi:hypothetical protein
LGSAVVAAAEGKPNVRPASGLLTGGTFGTVATTLVGLAQAEATDAAATRAMTRMRVLRKAYSYGHAALFKRSRFYER